MSDPYYADEWVTLYLGDCREVLPALGIQADLIVADPPYGETSLAWDRWPGGWLDMAAAVTRSMWCFGSLRMLMEHSDEFRGAGWKLSQDVVWQKHNGSGFAADRFKRIHELVSHWYRGKWGELHHDAPRVPYSGPDNSRRMKRHKKPTHTGEIGSSGYAEKDTRMAASIIAARSMNGHAIHPTEKPVPLLRMLITYACPPGGLVVDPFAGSGSTLDAARVSGRRAIGVEANERYAERAAKRLCQGMLITGDLAAS